MPNSGSVRASLQTDQGRVRKNNQDFVAWQEPVAAEEEARDGWLYILADGAGGMDAGEVASQYATERTLHHYLSDGEADEWGRRLHDAMQAANTDLRELSARHAEQSRMATTMVATVIHGDEAHIGNVGDSRAYLWRRGRLRQITRDQSLVAKLVEEGAITAEEALTHPRRNVILYSLGSERQPRIDLYRLPLQAGDRLLLCSDGLTLHVSDEEMTAILGEQDPEQASETLINLANQRGGRDNISIGVLHFVPPHPVRDKSDRQPARSRPVPSPALQILLWLYTGFLALVQSSLILLVWFILHF